MIKNTIFLSDSALRERVLSAKEKYLGICRDNSISIGIYYKGTSYIVSDKPESADYKYDIGSVTKTITAHLILHLRDLGLIDLDKSVSEYILLRKGDYPTVRELLTHTAGYGHLTPCEITVPALLRHGYAKKNIYESCKANTLLRCLERRSNASRKRGRYGYSDFAYALLALIAEAVLKKPFAEVLESFVYNSLNLGDTVIEPEESTRFPKSAKRGQKVSFWKWYRDNPYIAGGGLVSTVSDMLRYLSLQIESGESFITDAHKLCEKTLSEKSNVACCIGWHTYKKSNQLWHVGGVGTFRSSLIFNKKLRIGVAVLGNSKGVRSANVHYIAKMIYSEIKINKIDFSRISYETQQ